MDKVGFTGTQRGMTDLQKAVVATFLAGNKIAIGIHGGCIGADIHFDDICYRNLITRVIYPSNIPEKYGWWHYTPFVMAEDKPLSRNHTIVDKSDLLIATPKETKEVIRSGTWATIRYAIKKHKSVYIIYPSGLIEWR